MPTSFVQIQHENKDKEETGDQVGDAKRHSSHILKLVEAGDGPKLEKLMEDRVDDKKKHLH